MPKVLVVDDSAVDRRLVGGLLRRAPDLHVHYASNGVEALERISEHLPDLVLTDLMMPEMNGLELVAAIVSQYPLVPVILITGRGSEEIAVKALQAGAASYVPKGVLSSLLLETVQHVLQVAREEKNEARLMDCLTRSEATFVLRNDPAMIPPLVNHLHRCARLLGVCDECDGVRVCVALEEAITNALFHGNLEISSELRTSDTDGYRRLVDQRMRSKPFCQRSVNIEARITRGNARFIIRDQGPGFDPSSLPDPTDPENLEKASGRGLLLMRTFMDSVEYNDKGNEVTLVKSVTRAVASMSV